MAVAPATLFEKAGLRLQNWLDAGYDGEMSYLKNRKEAYYDLGKVLEGAESVVMLTLNYGNEPPPPAMPGSGRVSRYAWGATDYHRLIRKKLKAFSKFYRQGRPGVLVRGVVDTAPLLEKEFAQLAGLGWIGKNTLLLNSRAGSWFFLAALLTDEKLPVNEPVTTSQCANCTACLEVCPTDAFVEPYVLDARKCISYLTIELRQPIPLEHREAIGDWVFGCDLCQEVCPYNKRTPQSTEPSFEPQEGLYPLEIFPLFSMTEETMKERFSQTPLWRTGRAGLLRNGAIVLGNQRPPEGIAVLIEALEDRSPVVRGAVVWALGQYLRQDEFATDREKILTALDKSQSTELDIEVLKELEVALMF